MRFGFYPRLALDGVRKNRRMYFPYFLTCIGMVMMYYMVSSVQYNENISRLPGSEPMLEMLQLGSWIIAFFACIFLFYTNSFLMRRRKREFGLYNILGMDKHNLSKLLAWESLFLFGGSVIFGLFFGVLLSKFAEAGVVYMLGGTLSYDLPFAGRAVSLTVVIFAAVHLLLLLNGLRQIQFSGALALARSESVGEKPPKANWVLGMAGFLILGGAYYIAVAIEDPITALVWFFAAAIMVIAATYLIMISGSVLLCRILQKNKRYYYKAEHFVSISSMAYRMKRNGAGLASICILSTMVLVITSAPVTLLIGNEEALRNRFPREFVSTYYSDESLSLLSDHNISILREEVKTHMEENGIVPSNLVDYRSVGIGGIIKDGEIIFDYDAYEAEHGKELGVYSSLSQVYLIPLDDYNRMTGENETLAEGEALLYPYRMKEYPRDQVSFRQGPVYQVKKVLEDCFVRGTVAESITPTLFLIVPDIEKAAGALTNQEGTCLAVPTWEYAFDVDADKEEQAALFQKFQGLYEEEASEGQFLRRRAEWRSGNREDFFHTFGGLFYLGMVLSTVFVFGAVLIIYYKQIAEGYEDASRFEIMQKVGMTKKEIRKSINSQLLTVFFLPLLTAGLHLAFAFPMIEKLLHLFGLYNTRLFAVTMAACFLAFALCYAVVYKITSNAYYHIVSGARER